MPSPLDPNLAKVEENYNRLYDAVQAGAMNFADAEKNLAEFKVIDGSGAVWSMNSEGRFLSGMPGDQPVPTDSIHFKPSQLPPRQDNFSGPSSWGSEDIFIPPSASSGPSSNSPSQMNFPRAGGGPEDSYDDEDDYSSPPAPSRAPANGSRSKKPASEKVGGLAGGVVGAVSGVGDRLKGSPVGAKVKENKRPVVIAVIAVLVVLAIFYFKGGSDDTGEGLPSGVPTAGSTPLEEMPADGSDPAVAPPAEVPTDATTPDQGQVNALINAVTSGDTGLAGASVINPGEASDILIQTTQLGVYNTDSTTLVLTAGPAVATAEGAVADLTVSDKDSGDALKVIKVNFAKNDNGGWSLSGWPNIK